MSSQELKEIRKLKADLAEVRDGINEIEAYISALHGRERRRRPRTGSLAVLHEKN